MRVVTVGAVIAVHATSVMLGSASVTGEGVLTVLHTSREVFLCLSAFVLTYSAWRRPEPTTSFWRRRFPLVLGPYLVWSAVYLVANTSGWASGTSLAVTKRLAVDVLSAGASYHLYFLLLTLQLYVVFPSFVRLLRQHERWHGPVLAGSVMLQVGFTAAIAYGLVLPGPLGAWLAHPGSWLPSYQLYVVVGVLAGLHFERCAAWVRHHGRLIAAAAITAVALGAGMFVVNLLVLGMAPAQAGAVFQPAIVVESLVAVVALYALGLRVVERLADRRRHQLAAGSDVSFGVYLAHPLLLQGLVALGTAAGLRAWWQALPGPVAEAIVLAAVV
ncbi:MAG: acyltransferase family protein, partial [Actinomycetes bacterium]